MRVGFDLFEYINYPFRGIGRYERYLVQALAKLANGVELSLFCPSEGREAAREELSCEGVNFHTVNLSLKRRKLLWMLSNTLRWPLDHRVGPVDVFHAPDFVGPVLKHAPLVCTVHDMAPWFFRETRTWRNSFFFKVAFVSSARRAMRIITDSNSIKNDLGRMLPDVAEKTVPIHLATGSEFSPAEDQAVTASLQDRLGLSGPFILAVSTLEPRKNYPVLLEAFAALIAQEPAWADFRLVVVGKPGWRHEEIFAVYRRLGLGPRVIWAHSLTDTELCQLYVHCQAFVMPSLYEGFGLPVLEAMACGAPVVISNDAALVEIAEDAAIIVDPRRAQDLAAALRLLLQNSDLRQDLRRRGLARAHHFSWEATARATLRVYEEAVHDWQQVKGDR